MLEARPATLGELWGRICRPHHLRRFFDFLVKVDPTSERFRFRAAKAKAKIVKPWPSQMKKWIEFGQDQPERLALADGKEKKFSTEHRRIGSERTAWFEVQPPAAKATRLGRVGARTEGLIRPRLCRWHPVA